MGRFALYQLIKLYWDSIRLDLVEIKEIYLVILILFFFLFWNL